MKKITIAIVGVFMVWTFVCPSTLIKVKVSTANVRENPDLWSQVIVQYSLGTILEALEKEGEWYRINLPADEQGIIRTGYIHTSTVEEMTGAAQTIERSPVQNYPVESSPAPSVQGNMFTGFTTKAGLMFSPPAGGFGDQWILGFGYDFSVLPYVSLGFEVQPAFRSYSEIDLFILPVMAFANARLGTDLGVLWNKLRFLGVYGGGGLGLESSFAVIGTDDETLTDFKTRFAYHFFAGLEFDLKGANPFIEYQAIQVSYPETEENFFMHFLMLGLRF